MKPKIIDCITFYNENFIFELRYNVIKDFVDYFVVCESKYDHKGNKKNLNFDIKKYSKDKKIKYVVHEDLFPKNNNPWSNQAIQREFLLKSLTFLDDEDYIFFSDPDEIPNPKILENIILNKKYGIFLQECFNYKFNLYNPNESPWEGTRVCKKKNLKSINFMRQKVLSKNLRYPFWRLDKEKDIQIFDKAGWHFNNILTPEEISIKLKTFAHTEFAEEKYSNIYTIEKKINQRIDLFERGHQYIKKNINTSFPEFLVKELKKKKNFILE